MIYWQLQAKRELRWVGPEENPNCNCNLSIIIIIVLCDNQTERGGGGLRGWNAVCIITAAAAINVISLSVMAGRPSGLRQQKAIISCSCWIHLYQPTIKISLFYFRTKRNEKSSHELPTGLKYPFYIRLQSSFVSFLFIDPEIVSFW